MNIIELQTAYDEIIRLSDKIAQIKNTIKVAEDEHLKNVEGVNNLYDPKIRDLHRCYGHQAQIDELNKEKNARLENPKNKDTAPKSALKQQNP